MQEHFKSEYSWYLLHKLTLISRVRRFGFDKAVTYVNGWAFDFTMSLKDLTEDERFHMWKYINDNFRELELNEDCPFWLQAKAELKEANHRVNSIFND